MSEEGEASTPATSRQGRQETPDQRSRRLARQREYNQRRRSNKRSSDSNVDNLESEARHQERLAYQREYRRGKLVNHQPPSGISDPSSGADEERQRRLTYQREYARQRRDDKSDQAETREERQHRLIYQREYAQRRREDERNREERLETRRVSDRRRQQGGDETGLNTTSTPRPLNADALEDVPTSLIFLNEQAHLASDANLAPVSDERVCGIESALERALGAEGLDETICAVCDRLVRRGSCQSVASSQARMMECTMRVLRAPTNLPVLLLAQYDCCDLDLRFKGLMLSRKGIRMDPQCAILNVCDECHAALAKGGTKPPKFAIANGFYVGLLPEHLFKSTWIEKVMTQLVTVVAQTRVMRGGRHRAIRSHCMVFDAKPGPPATLLPRRIDRDGPYRVVLAGPMTPNQTDRIRKLHHARGSMVRQLLDFFKSHNVMYSNVSIDDSAVDDVDADTSVCERIFMEVEDCEAAAAIDAEQESVAGHHDGIIVEGEDECAVIERNALLADDTTVTNATLVQQRVVDLNQHEPTATPRIRVNHSSRFASNIDVEAKMHPHLFPFGRGHPGEQRVTPVSKRECMKYYAMLSSRRFAQDPTFLLTSFSRLSLENMYTLTAVKCRRYESLFDGYEAISQAELTEALINNERRHRGEQRQVISNPIAERFLKSVELGSVSVWGSAAERRQCRQEAFGYQTRYGQPALFVTLTPNTDNSYAMAHYTGILSVNTLFDVLEAQAPSPAELKRAAMNDDCASARLFMRTVDAFITHVLGIDPKTQQSSQEGGRFGRTKAYFGMVETQGRGTLHIHFLIWLFGAPVNSAEFEDTLEKQGAAFQEGLEAYVDSIVTNSLPIPVDQAKCQVCRIQGNFVSLPIPSKSRRSLSKRSKDIPLEPLLVKCDACGHGCSAQHLIRQALLQHRPPHWPPPLTPLSEQAMAAMAACEARVRSSEADALDVVKRRELFHAAVEPDRSDEIADWVLRISDSSQLGYLHAEDDPVKIDPMNRLIEMTPPTLDRARMSPQHYAYMLAILVVNLNTHAWTHTSSCFKNSRATSSACVCRYGFPRQHAEHSSIAGSSITTKRTLGHEYVNGYNATIMAMFKCNHDIQVLFGGKDAINRIYYVCKYVTKPQRQIDSANAIALANFRRRQAKENVQTASANPPSLMDIRRRRVTRMTHTFTNKQEIAGPVAALYILRGSCCYASDTCVKLPLSEILKQLESSGDYECTLVRTREAVYTSASHLDDYIFRPNSILTTSLYEFFMRCYRRQMSSKAPDTHLFDDRHPLADSHCIAFRRKEAIPVIKGLRLQRHRETMTREQLEENAKIALVLFKPFRDTSDLLGMHESDENPWYPAFCQWEASRSDFTKMIMDNMNDYYAGREAENEAVIQGDEDREETESIHSDSDCNSSDDAYVSDDAYLEMGDGDATTDAIHIIDVAMEAPSDERLQTFPSPSSFTSRIRGVLEVFKDRDLVGRIASTCADADRDRAVTNQTPLELRKWVESAATDSSEDQEDGFDQSTFAATLERPTSVTELFDEALLPEQRLWNPGAPIPIEAPMYSGIAVISRLFTLNELQHGAFAIIATHLLRRWKPSSKASVISDEELDRRQLRMYLGGEGGTGKSRVIHAVQELCRCWQRPKSSVVCAMTGKAATLINGRTLASFEVSLKRPNSHIELQDVDCLIIDEVSMMSKHQLLRLSRALNKAKRVKGVAFGGIHIVLVGDFFQLPPVGADPLYIDPSSKPKNVTVVDFDGHELWRRFDKVVILRESVRFRDDPEWGEGCSKARYGEWTPAFVEMINSRVVTRDEDDGVSGQANSPSPPPPGSVFVSPDNDTRAAINGHFIACAAAMLPSGELPVRVVADFGGALNQISSADISYIMGLPDSKFGRMAPYLDLIRGMPIQVTQNIRTQKGVANGTTGFLEHVEFPLGTSFRRVLDKRTNAVVLLPDRRPLYALLRLNRGKNTKALSDGLPASVFPVFPDAEPFKKAEIALTPSFSGEIRKLLIKIKQFPFVCAVGATVYKVQGESLKSMVVVDWKVPVRGVNKPQQAYLMVSRVVKRDGLVCMTPLTEEIIAWAQPGDEAMEEDRRLAEESDKTLSSFYATQHPSH